MLSHNFECFKLTPIFIVTVLFDKQYSTIIAHKTIQIKPTFFMSLKDLIGVFFQGKEYNARDAVT